MYMTMKYLMGIIAILLLSCTSEDAGHHSPEGTAVSTEDELNETMSGYRNAWLRADSAQIMTYVSEDAVFFRPTSSERPLKGKNEIAKFWFPPSDLSYPVYEYELTNVNITAEEDLAVIDGISKLSWYQLEDGLASDSSTAITEFITILRREYDGWKYFRQMYNLKSDDYSRE
jgi:ketosteroid isomerase-like protein